MTDIPDKLLDLLSLIASNQNVSPKTLDRILDIIQAKPVKTDIIDIKVDHYPKHNDGSLQLMKAVVGYRNAAIYAHGKLPEVKVAKARVEKLNPTLFHDVPESQAENIVKALRDEGYRGVWAQKK